MTAGPRRPTRNLLDALTVTVGSPAARFRSSRTGREDCPAAGVGNARPPFHRRRLEVGVARQHLQPRDGSKVVALAEFEVGLRAASGGSDERAASRVRPYRRGDRGRLRPSRHPPARHETLPAARSPPACAGRAPRTARRCGAHQCVPLRSDSVIRAGQVRPSLRSACQTAARALPAACRWPHTAGRVPGTTRRGPPHLCHPDEPVRRACHRTGRGAQPVQHLPLRVPAETADVPRPFGARNIPKPVGSAGGRPPREGICVRRTQMRDQTPPTRARRSPEAGTAESCRARCAASAAG